MKTLRQCAIHLAVGGLLVGSAVCLALSLHHAIGVISVDAFRRAAPSCDSQRTTDCTQTTQATVRDAYTAGGGEGSDTWYCVDTNLGTDCAFSIDLNDRIKPGDTIERHSFNGEVISLTYDHTVVYTAASTHDTLVASAMTAIAIVCFLAVLTVAVVLLKTGQQPLPELFVFLIAGGSLAVLVPGFISHNWVSGLATYIGWGVIIGGCMAGGIAVVRLNLD